MLKEINELKSGWQLRKIAPADRLDIQSILPPENDREWYSISEMPAQVHDILLEHKVLSEKVLLGWTEEAEWISDFDWVYVCSFAASAARSMPSRLRFAGLDTVVDIYLNGELIGAHNDFFTSLEIDTTGKLAQSNSLVLHFHNILEYMNKQPFADEWRKTMLRCAVVRKPKHDFPEGVTVGSSYQGAVKYYSPIGVYGKIELICPDMAEITADHVQANLNKDLKSGDVEFHIQGTADTNNLQARIALTAPDGHQVNAETIKIAASNGRWEAKHILEIKNPELWWPRGYGSQPLYTVQIDLLADGNVRDSLSRKIGFRHIENPYPLSFIINGKKVRLWGGSMDPLQGWTHRLVRERMDRLLDMVENANMNTLRVWGEGIPVNDYFYDECDRRGIMVWQDFYFGNSSYPDSQEYREIYKREAAELIVRLRHHPALILWCGGNETLMGSEHIDRNIPVYGIDILTKVLPDLVSRLDPGRYYHISSPSGGEWANDPRAGDTHTYDCLWYYPYKKYPNFISENIRTSPPVLHSLKKIIRGELWPEGYTGKFMADDIFPYPENWAERSMHAVYGHVKTGPYWEYYDADNAYDHIYRFAASYAQILRQSIGRVRMGGPAGNTPPALRSKGHFACKLLDTWPKVYCALIDFFQEGFMPYYQTLRSLEPVHVCFNVEDEIDLWLVNDSPDDISGSITFGLFDLESNKFAYLKKMAAGMKQGESDIMLNLNYLKFFKKSLVLYARFEEDGRKRTSTAVDYIDVERHYKFPAAKITATIKGNEIHINTDKFARCVEITGKSGGSDFGWLFSDNYFDLVPGETRIIKIACALKGDIVIKAHYSPHITTVSNT